jgi:hypothetical protein
MDASSLARDLDNLEKSWASLDWWLNAWTILVVVGVAVELLVIITEYAHDWRDFRRGTIHTPDKPSILIFGLGFLGAAMVPVGVAGEFQIHVKAGKIESDMRSKSRELVGMADGKAADAEQKAGESNERASKANERAAQAQAQAARLTKEAEKLKKDAEDERLARVKIEETIAWRAPKSELIDTLSSSLQQFSGQRWVLIDEEGEPERINVAVWLVKLLGASKWSFETGHSITELSLPATNLVVWVTPNAPDRVVNAAKALVPVLDKADLPATFLQIPWGPPPESTPRELIRVVVFRKGPKVEFRAIP